MTYYDLEELKKHVNYDGNYHKNLKKVLQYLTPEGKFNFDDWEIEDGVIKHTLYDYKCSCEHTIQFEYRVKHKVTGDSISIGCQCINLFNNDTRKKRNVILRKCKNPNSKYCPRCDKKVQDTVVKLYPTTENIYHKSCWKKKEAEERIKKLEIYSNKRITCCWCKHKPKRKNATKHEDKHEIEKDIYKAMIYILDFGKHKGKNLLYVWRYDRDYFHWILKNAYSYDVEIYACCIYSARYKRTKLFTTVKKYILDAE
jgi:hypothetical protein